MKETQIMVLDDTFTLYRTEELTDEIVDFLENTAFGTKDNLYRHYYIREFVNNTPGTDFYFARKNGKELVAMVAFCRRTFVGEKPYEGSYLRYFAASPSVRGQKLVGKFSGVVIDWLREQQKSPIIFFGTIEGRNKASQAIANHLAFEEFAPIRTVGFSRFSPKMKGEVSRVTPEEWKEILPRLDQFYKDYAYWTHAYLNLGNDYYVLKKDGRIVCGAQVHKAHWVVENLAGFIGKYVLPVLPYIPVLRDIFNPKAFHFLNFEGIFVEKGHEADLIDLFESVLHIKKFKTAMLWFDERDAIYQFLEKQGQMGLFNRFTRDAKATFVVDYSRFGEKEAKALAGRLCYPCGYDYI